MSDLICRKTMTRCQTLGMCAPHGGCQSQHDRDSSELCRLCAERDQLHDANQRLEGEVARLREALHVILNEVDGNLTPTIRDLVNRAAGVNNGTHPNELYEYCETIESAAHTALSTANGEVTE